MKKIQHLALLALFFIASCASQPPQIVKEVVKETVYVKETQNAPATVAKLKKYKITTDHFPSVGQDERVRFLILHYTAIDNETSIRALTKNQVSAHYLVPDDRSNEIYHLVDESKRAWHAGVSSWKGINNINFSSIGIEIVNFGGYDGVDELGDPKIFYYHYPEHQIDKVGVLSKDIVERYNIDPVHVLGHSDVAPQRKPDPGANFPWKRLYDEYGVGAWYEEPHKEMYMAKYPYADVNSYSFILSVQKDLEKYGYEIQKTGEWDKQTKKVLIAFQCHFRPSNYSGIIDAETWSILQALNLKYRS